MRILRYVGSALAATAMVVVVAGSALAAPATTSPDHREPPGHREPPRTAPGHDKLVCFDGPSDRSIHGGECTLLSRGAKGAALLDNTDGDLDGSYSGVYVLYSNLYGQRLSAIRTLSFTYTGEAGALAPRIRLPVDETGDGDFEAFAFIPAYTCNDGSGSVDAIDDPTCTILYGPDSYANWDAFVAAYPSAVVNDDHLAWVIADEPGRWIVNHVRFGKPGR